MHKYRRVHTLILFILIAAAPVPLRAQEQNDNAGNLCYAFGRLHGEHPYSGRQGNALDITVVCNGEMQRITNDATVSDFAISADGNFLVLGKHSQQGSQILEVISLGVAGRSHTLRSKLPAYLIATCGSVLLHYSYSPSHLLDLSTGKEMDFRPYHRLACSSDRKVIIGQRDDTYKAPLFSGFPPRVQIAPGATFFNVSPSGNFNVFFVIADKPNRSELCVTEGSKEPICTKNLSGEGYSNYNLSVRDDGMVILSIPTDEDCGGDACPAVAYWSPRDTDATILQMRAVKPQWISSQTAAALMRWSTKQSLKK